jgi:hypothetical protein
MVSRFPRQFILSSHRQLLDITVKATISLVRGTKLTYPMMPFGRRCTPQLDVSSWLVPWRSRCSVWPMPIGACLPRTRTQTNGAAVRGQLGRFCTLSSHIFDSDDAPLYFRTYEEKTGTITRRPYRSMQAPMYDIVPRYPSRVTMTMTCTKRQDIVGHSCLCRSQDYLQTRQKVEWSDTVG